MASETTVRRTLAKAGGCALEDIRRAASTHRYEPDVPHGWEMNLHIDEIDFCPPGGASLQLHECWQCVLPVDRSGRAGEAELSDHPYLATESQVWGEPTIHSRAWPHRVIVAYAATKEAALADAQAFTERLAAECAEVSE